MRIALITRRFDLAGGGTERDLAITADLLARAGHQIIIYTGEMRGPMPPWPVKMAVGRLLGRSLQFLWFARSAVGRAREGGADLVLSFARVIGADILRSGGGAHASYVRAAGQWQSPIARAATRLSAYHRIQMAVERAAFRHAHLRKTIAVSRMVRDDLIASFALQPAQVVTLYNGVDKKKFAPARDEAERTRLRDQLDLADGQRAVLFVGSGFGRKGLGFLIEAWARLRGSPLLLIAGGDRAVAAYERLAGRYGVAGRVRFLGRRGDVESLMRAADALALPSLFEPFGNVAVEAMASGLPVLTTSRCGSAEIVPDELRPMIVANPADVAELAAKTQLLIDAPPGLGASARAASEKFTWQRYATELLAIIDAAR
jgi:UDP-glucose:(heptosyl)LPS alpha-1,3-glucosyltransferase